MYSFNNRGNTIAEYALFIGVFLVFGFSSVTLLGHSIAELFNTSSSVKTQGLLNSYMNVTLGGAFQSGGGLQAGGGSQNQGKGNAANSQGQYLTTNQMLNALSPAAVNATSADGNTGTKVLMKSLSLIQRIEAVAAQQTDPSLKSELLQIAYQGYYLSVAQASYEYSQNTSDNPILKNLADLGETPGFDLSKDPGIALLAIEHKTSQVGTKAGDFLNDPAASPQDKQVIKQVVGEIYHLSMNQYSSKFAGINDSSYPALSNTETGGTNVRTAAVDTLTAYNESPSPGTTLVKTTVKDSVVIENKSNEQTH